MKHALFVAALALSTAAFAQERPEDRANLADLYPDVAAWNADAAKVDSQLQEFAQCRGKLGESAQRLLRCLELETDFSKRLARMAVYAGELFSHDTGVASSLKEATVYAKVRSYADSLDRSLDNNRVPKGVYDALIAATNKNLPTLHRYFRLRAKMLGVTDMRYYDIYPPLVSGGDEYVAGLTRFEGRWMDVYPRPRKFSGAHMAGSAYDVHPYLLINYTGNYESVTTIAHEWGHAIHSYLANRTQPFPTAGYAIFTAEIASSLNEALLLEYMLKTAKTDDERLLYLGSALEGLRATFFRQAMFAEFEREVHKRVDAGEPMTGDKFTKLYGEILRRYHGERGGVMKIDDLYAIEWAYIPHFYSNFYVYQYAISIAASALFADAILKGEPGARDRYLNLLKSGGSDYPYELVKKAGVDLATAAPYEALVARMNRIMDEIEAILARKGK